MVLEQLHNSAQCTYPTGLIPPVRPIARRRGFTLVEILAVLGIIGVLVGIVAVALNVVFNNAAANRTRVALDTAKGLFTEYENLNPLKNTSLYTTGVNVNNVGGLPDVHQQTVLLMIELGRVPANRSALEKMAGNTIASKTVNISGTDYTAPIPLDGWGTPILYVGTGGLSNVDMVYKNGDPSSNASFEKPNQTVTSPDRRPFWVSAGPDTDFRTGDDNVYSFEN